MRDRPLDFGSNSFAENLGPFVCFSFDLCRMGFHLPPFTSVPHLHLHTLCPASTMNLRSQLHYGPQSHWFITVSDIVIFAVETGAFLENTCGFNFISIPCLTKYLQNLYQVLKLACSETLPLL